MGEERELHRLLERIEHALRRFERRQQALDELVLEVLRELLVRLPPPTYHPLVGLTVT